MMMIRRSSCFRLWLVSIPGARWRALFNVVVQFVENKPSVLGVGELVNVFVYQYSVLRFSLVVLPSFLCILVDGPWNDPERGTAGCSRAGP